MKYVFNQKLIKDDFLNIKLYQDSFINETLNILLKTKVKSLNCEDRNHIVECIKSIKTDINHYIKKCVLYNKDIHKQFISEVSLSDTSLMTRPSTFLKLNLTIKFNDEKFNKNKFIDDFIKNYKKLIINTLNKNEMVLF